MANAGICSRREADVLIQTGVVSINNVIVTELGYKIKPGDSIGKLEGITMQERHMYKSNNLCNLKDKNGLRANDVVVMSMLPSM